MNPISLVVVSDTHLSAKIEVIPRVGAELWRNLCDRVWVAVEPIWDQAIADLSPEWEARLA